MPDTQPQERRYSVAGMTCAHCVAAVAEEVTGVPGVTAVDIDLARGSVAVRGTSFTDDAISGAVAEAGYEVVGVGA